MRMVYQFLLLLAYPLVLLRLWWRGRREPEYRRRISERLGHAPADIPVGVIWLHSVSAGETNALAPVIAQLKQRHPDQAFLVTTMTPTGSAQVKAMLGELVWHCYAPYDFPWAVRRFYARVQPRLLVLMETELWPNLIAGAHDAGIGALLINARLSERSAAGYGRVRWLVTPMLQQLNALACQEPEHQARFIALGANPATTAQLGSIKFDKVLPADHEQRVAGLRDQWQLHNRWVWIAASTHPGEDEPLLEAHKRLCERVATAPASNNAQPTPLLLLVPRHPVRADDVLTLARQMGVNAARQCDLQPDIRPDLPASAAELDVIVADTMGQLQTLYGLAQVAFIGGSWQPIGGHDPIEAALCELPMVMGAQRFNFVQVCERFEREGALVLAEDAQALVQVLLRWYQDADQARAQGLAAAAVVAANTGARQRTVALLSAHIDAHIDADSERAS